MDLLFLKRAFRFKSHRKYMKYDNVPCDILAKTAPGNNNDP